MTMYKPTIKQIATWCVRATLDNGLPSGGGNGPVPSTKQIKRVERVLKLHLWRLIEPTKTIRT